MLPWNEIATSPVPNGWQPMRLMQRGEEFSITVGGIELMNNRRFGSEKALADLTCAALSGRSRPRILIGGLGMGFTLRAALQALPADACVVVSELVPAVVEWARGPLAEVFGGILDDPRVEIRTEDVSRTIQSGQAGFDAIMLDVDNGPDGLTQAANDRLYDGWGLKRARYALKNGGVLAVWSGRPDRKFKARLGHGGFRVAEHRVHAHGAKGSRHVVWLAEKTGGGAW